MSVKISIKRGLSWQRGRLPRCSGVGSWGAVGASVLSKVLMCWKFLWRSYQNRSSWSLQAKICRPKSHKHFSDKLGKIREKILLTPKNLPAPYTYATLHSVHNIFFVDLRICNVLKIFPQLCEKFEVHDQCIFAVFKAILTTWVNLLVLHYWNGLFTKWTTTNRKLLEFCLLQHWNVSSVMPIVNLRMVAER